MKKIGLTLLLLAVAAAAVGYVVSGQSSDSFAPEEETR